MLGLVKYLENDIESECEGRCEKWKRTEKDSLTFNKFNLTVKILSLSDSVQRAFDSTFNFKGC